MNWKSVREDGLPIMRYEDKGEYATIEATKECIVTDGEDVWVDNYCLEEGFYDSVTHYIIIEDIELPSIG